MNQLSEYLDEMRLESGAWLGHVVLWHLPTAARVPIKTLHAAMDAAELDKFKPPLPRLINTFRNISSLNARRRVPTDDPNIFENYKIEEVVRADRRVVKDIVVQRVNGKDEELSYDIQVRITYTSSNDEVTYRWIGSGDPDDHQDDQSMNLARLIAEQFREATESYNSNIIRSLLREILDHCLATPIFNKAHFVSNDHARRVAGLAMLSNEIADINIIAIPLHDSAKQREMIKHAYEAATVGKINAALMDLDNLKGKQLSVDQLGDLMTQKQALKERTKEYSTLLQSALDESENWISIYEARVMQLLREVEAQQ